MSTKRINSIKTTKKNVCLLDETFQWRRQVKCCTMWLFICSWWIQVHDCFFWGLQDQFIFLVCVRIIPDPPHRCVAVSFLCLGSASSQAAWASTGDADANKWIHTTLTELSHNLAHCKTIEYIGCLFDSYNSLPSAHLTEGSFCSAQLVHCPAWHEEDGGEGSYPAQRVGPIRVHVPTVECQWLILN